MIVISFCDFDDFVYLSMRVIPLLSMFESVNRVKFVSYAGFNIYIFLQKNHLSKGIVFYNYKTSDYILILVKSLCQVVNSVCSFILINIGEICRLAGHGSTDKLDNCGEMALRDIDWRLSSGPAYWTSMYVPPWSVEIGLSLLIHCH